jgi:hypothetical protein
VEGLKIHRPPSFVHDGRTTGKRSIQNAAERVEIGRARDLAGTPEDLLGRHVARCARVRRWLRGCAALAEAWIQIHPSALGEAEVEKARPPCPVSVEVDDQVGRLQIAVDDTARVGVGQRRQHLIDQRPEQVPVDRITQDLLERNPFDQIHHEVRCTVTQLAEIARSHDVLVVQRGERLRLGHEPRQRFVGIRLGQHHALHGTELARFVATRVHHPHATFADHTNHFVAVG